MEHDLKKVKENALADFSRYISPMKVRTMKAAGLDIIEDKREGACVWDITGKKYIDCQTGSGIMNVGRRNNEIVAALKKALDTYDIGVFLLCSKPKADLAKKLAEITPGDLACTIFGVGGGEANDAAIKIARGYTMKKEIIYTEKAYHGHTGFALSAIGWNSTNGGGRRKNCATVRRATPRKCKWPSVKWQSPIGKGNNKMDKMKDANIGRKLARRRV